MRHDEDVDQQDEVAEAVEAAEAAEEHEGAGAGRLSGVVGFAGGLLCGALIGAGIALLVAPERGIRLRRRLARSLREAGDDLRDEFGGFRDSARRRLARRRRRLRRGVGHVVS
jgi:hypothetical protein